MTEKKPNPQFTVHYGDGTPSKEIHVQSNLDNWGFDVKAFEDYANQITNSNRELSMKMFHCLLDFTQVKVAITEFTKGGVKHG